MSRDLQVLRVRGGKTGFPAEMESRGLEGCLVQVDLVGMLGGGVQLVVLD